MGRAPLIICMVVLMALVAGSWALMAVVPLYIFADVIAAAAERWFRYVVIY